MTNFDRIKKKLKRAVILNVLETIDTEFEQMDVWDLVNALAESYKNGCYVGCPLCEEYCKGYSVSCDKRWRFWLLLEDTAKNRKDELVDILVNKLMEKLD